MRILLTTTSYQDTPGHHHTLLEESGFEVVRARGPLTEQEMLDLIAGEGFDGLLNGDDEITAKVIDAALPRMRVIAKYGIGLDSIDVPYATEKKIPVLFTPGVNHTTVAEHTFGLMIAMAKKFYMHMHAVQEGQWKRVTGNELAGKKIAVLGMGRIGKEVIKRAVAFDMIPTAFDLYWDEDFAAKYDVARAETAESAITNADIVSLHMGLTDDTREFINSARISLMKDGAMIVNTARGGLANEEDVVAACKSGKLAGYASDVLVKEPIQAPHIFQGVENIIVTPHIGSRTYESVERQAVRATKNIINFLNGDEDFIQANQF